MSMKTTVQVVLAIVVVLCLTLCGCPKKVQQVGQAVQTARDAQDGDFTVKTEKGEEVKVETKGEGEGGSVTVTGSEGKMEVGEDVVKQEDVGIDFYPGASVEGGGKMSGGKEGGSWASVSLETGDPFDKVASFYKEKYAKGNTVMESPGSLIITITAGENKGKLIIVSEDKEQGVTTIAIQSAADAP